MEKAGVAKEHLNLKIITLLSPKVSFKNPVNLKQREFIPEEGTNLRDEDVKFSNILGVAIKSAGNLRIEQADQCHSQISGTLPGA